MKPPPPSILRVKTLQEALNRLLENRTAVIIAHRLATIRKADKIIVLQDGRIIESGIINNFWSLGGSTHSSIP